LLEYSDIKKNKPVAIIAREQFLGLDKTQKLGFLQKRGFG